MANRSGIILAASAVLACSAPIAPATASETDEVQINIEVAPIAYLVFDSTPLLYLEIPPPGSTVPSNGVFFRVIGNASATLTAEPDAFINVPGEGYMGKAVLGLSEVGYNLELRFPRLGVSGSPIQISVLPGFEEGPTVPSNPVDLLLTGGEREGVIHMETSQEWTEHGGLPLAGIHVGEVILTLSADY